MPLDRAATPAKIADTRPHSIRLFLKGGLRYNIYLVVDSQGGRKRSERGTAEEGVKDEPVADRGN